MQILRLLFCEKISDNTDGIPYKYAQPEARALVIDGFQTGYQCVEAAVLDKCYDSRGHRRPCVGSVVGFAVDTSAAYNVFPRCEATAAVAVEYFDYMVVVSLVKSYEY